MKLVMRLTTGARDGNVPASCSFGEYGGGIGRDPDNLWVLPGDEMVSRNHCRIDFEGGVFWLTDTSSNGVFANHSLERLERGRRIRLTDGDHLRIGDYEVDLSIEAPDHEDTFFGVIEAKTKPPRLPDHIERLLDPDPPATARPAVARPVPPPREIGFGDGAGPMIAADDSIFGVPAPRIPTTTYPPEPSRHFSLDPGIRPALIPEDDYLGPGRALIPDDLEIDADIAAAFSPRAAPPPATTSAPASTRPQEPELPAESLLPPVDAVRPPPPPPAPASAAIPLAAEAGGAAWRAFMSGAGLPAGAAGDQEAQLRLAGLLLRQTLAGLHGLLRVRGDLKQQLRLDVTGVRLADNNPLKVYATIEEALAHMLGPAQPGFLGPGPAVDEAIRDLKDHEIALIASLQETGSSLLATLDPRNIEDRRPGDSLVKSLMPTVRKAALWDAFCAHFAEIAAQWHEEGGEALGRDFAAAYRRQTQGDGGGDL